MTGLSKLFSPASIAVVGASDDVGKIRGKVLQNIIRSKFSGPVFPISRSAPEVQGLKAYGTIGEIPQTVDLAVVGLAAAQVLGSLEECAAAGVGAAIVFASGFAEGGDAAAQAKITELCRRTGLRVLGPNTLGVFNFENRVAATFSPVMAEQIKHLDKGQPPGEGVDIICQSGGLGFALYSHAVSQGIAVRNVVTTGNEADCEALEIAEHLIKTSGSKAILLFIEGFKDPGRLVPVARLAAERGVTLLMTKVGASEAGRRAAVSHTAHLTGADAVQDAIFAREGIIRVADPEQMLAMAKGLTRLPAMKGNRVAIVTTSGGTGGWASDIFSGEGLSVPEPSPALRKELDALIPGFGSAANPIDVTATVVEDKGVGLAKVIALVAGCGEYDAAFVSQSLVPPGRIAGMRAFLEPILAARQIPILFHSPGIPGQDNLDQLAELSSGNFGLRDAASALCALRDVGAFQARRRDAGPVVPRASRGTEAQRAAGVLGGADRAAVRALLGGYGIPTPGEGVAASAEEAARLAQVIGFPLAMKIESADIPHKTDAGCVALGVADTAACAEAFARIIANAKAHAPSADVRGVLLQKMAPPGVEMVVGLTRDVQFGPVIMLGFGGVYVEVLKDSVLSPAPVSHAEALRMIESLKGAAILKGARGQPPADIAALAEVLVGLSDLALDAGEALVEADLNPVIVYPAGHGAAVVDYLFVTQGAAAPALKEA